MQIGSRNTGHFSTKFVVVKGSFNEICSGHSNNEMKSSLTLAPFNVGLSIFASILLMF